MPVLHVELWEGRTREDKAQMARALTDELVRILKCRPEAVTIIFSNVSKEDWARGGVLVADEKK